MEVDEKQLKRIAEQLYTDSLLMLINEQMHINTSSECSDSMLQALITIRKLSYEHRDIVGKLPHIEKTLVAILLTTDHSTRSSEARLEALCIMDKIPEC